MLWINGYTSGWSRRLGLAPEEGRPYWGSTAGAAGYALKDWNWLFIHPNGSAFSTAKTRYEAGYHFAAANERKLIENIILSGNVLQVVSHSQGTAFAEGIMSYLYEEKDIVADLAIHLNPCQAATVPQTRRAVECRLSFRTQGDPVVNKRNEELRFTDINIMETALDNGFCKYGFSVSAQNGEILKSHLYLKGTYSLRTAHVAHRQRFFQLWQSINHALKLYKDTRLEPYRQHESGLKLASIQQFWQNQN